MTTARPFDMFSRSKTSIKSLAGYSDAQTIARFADFIFAALQLHPSHVEQLGHKLLQGGPPVILW